MSDKFEKQRLLCYTVPGIKQVTNDTCWCAALAWWAKALGSRPNLDKNQVFFEYAHLTKGGNGPGANLISPSKFKEILDEPKWKAKYEEKIGGIGPLFLKSKLESGPIIVAYTNDASWRTGHVVVVVAPSITYRRENKFMVMDPAFGTVRAYSYGLFSTYQYTFVAMPL